MTFEIAPFPSSFPFNRRTLFSFFLSALLEDEEDEGGDGIYLGLDFFLMGHILSYYWTTPISIFPYTISRIYFSVFTNHII
ncbi:hypothetical protein Hanom_Chr10g00967221 [Helianthus anomalus]